jgi:hypothetical protein
MDIEARTCMKDIPDSSLGEVPFSFLVREVALGHLHPLVLVYEDSNVLDVGLVSLMPAQDE